MIQAVIFDLDGTLVQTERLKALSYARAAVELCPHNLAEETVVEEFKRVVGRPRREVAQHLVDRFNLEAAARVEMERRGLPTPWQAYVQVRLGHYREFLVDPDVLRDNQWPHNRDLLRIARQRGCLTGLATMSNSETARRVLEVLELVSAFDFVATRDDVEQGKPDPEIYLLVATQLGVAPTECLVVEDSPAGVRSALAAGMVVVAVSTPFTRKSLHALGVLPESHIVDEVPRLTGVVDHVVSHLGDAWPETGG
jgi:HAD superfamily hydrolase (TIGR01509 family)